MSGLVRLALLLGTQTSSPLARVLTRVIQISVSDATSSRPSPRNRTHGRACRYEKMSFAALPGPSRKPNARCFVPEAIHILGGNETDQGHRTFQGCNNCEPSPKTAQIVQESQNSCPLARNSHHIFHFFAATPAR